LETEFVMGFLIDLTTIVGTIWAVLAILCMKPSDIYAKATWNALESADRSALVQKKQARSGITLIIISFVYKYFIGPIIEHFCPNMPLKYMAISYILILLVVMLIIKRWNSVTTKSYDRYIKNLRENK
jgi:Bacitracin resistance protein BacA.